MGVPDFFKILFDKGFVIFKILNNIKLENKKSDNRFNQRGRLGDGERLEESWEKKLNLLRLNSLWRMI